MCYGMNCRYEHSYTGDCKKPRNVPCPLDDEPEIDEEELEVERLMREAEEHPEEDDET